MSQEVIFKEDAKKRLQKGVNKISDAISSTLGPSGTTCCIQKGTSAYITKDGVTVSKSISFSDSVENMGASLIKEVAGKAAEKAGDGTTTATVLAQSMINTGIKNVVAGANPIEIKKGIDKAVKYVINFLKENSIEVGDDFEKVKNIAAISANNDEEIGIIIADALSKVKKDGILTVEESKSMETYTQVQSGMELDKGFISPYFCNQKDKQECVLENPVILFYEKTISQFQSLIPILEMATRSAEFQGRPLLIVAENVDGEALTGLVINKLKGTLKVCAIKAPSYGDAKKDILQDLAILTGGEVLFVDKGMTLDNMMPQYFGTAEKVIITKDTTTIINGGGPKEAIENRAQFIKNQMEETTNDYDKEKLQQRLAKLVGGVAVVYVGAGSEVELKEKKDRVDDALCATRAAIQEGIIPGGSVAYIRASLGLDNLEFENEDQKLGIHIVKNALQTPIKIIANNVGKINGEVVLNEIICTGEKNDWFDYGYDAKNDKYCGMIQAGIIDPTKVARVALENAASVASMLLTTNCVIFDEKEETPNTNAAMPMMPGM